MRTFFFILFALLVTSFSLKAEEKSKPLVLVSIGTDKFFVESLAKNQVHIEVLVPSGASPHFFEPSPKQAVQVSKASLWLRRGESFEKKLLSSIKAVHPNLRIIDLRDPITLIHGGHHCNHHHEHHHDDADDPHTWTSPKNAILHVEHILNELIALLPEKEALFRKEAEVLTAKLKLYDKRISEVLEPFEGAQLLVSHPAFAYFCRDYKITQVSVEFDGKEPSPKQIHEVMHHAQEHATPCVLLQTQYNNKGALLIAKTLNLPTETVDPYSEAYFEMLETLTKSILQAPFQCDDY